MCKVNYAAIDIGSNAARLLIKSVSDEGVMEKQQLVRVPLRLGFDVFADGKISDSKSKKLIRLMKSFYHLMRIYDVKYYRACATSAMRDAQNSASLIKKVEESTKIKIDLISGMEEAKIIYGNHIECQKNKKGSFIYVDVGGGSTEINLLHKGKLSYSMSYDIGTVRILSGAVKQETWDKLKQDLKRISKGIDTINIVGSGGNINRLYKLSPRKNIKNQTMPITSLEELYEELKKYDSSQLQELYKLKADRADVIVPAAKIFMTVSSAVHSQYVHVPVLGLTDGIIDEMYLNPSKEYLF
ncbi:MAG: Ppx/GppA family phosphatase [Rikenellaceae bacterium]